MQPYFFTALLRLWLELTDRLTELRWLKALKAVAAFARKKGSSWLHSP